MKNKARKYLRATVFGLKGDNFLYKYELHLHTSECDKVATVSGADSVKKYIDLGYSGMVVTDHCFSIFHEWYKNELKGMTHKQKIERWLKGYYQARNEGEKHGFTVLPGAEVRFNGTNNDYLVYGLTEDFFYNAPFLHELKNLNELVSVLPSDALIVQAHPFRDGMTVSDPSLLFGIEAHNGCNPPFRNELAKAFAIHYEKPMTSGSDYHGYTKPASGGIETNEIIKTPYELVSVLKSGNYKIIEN